MCIYKKLISDRFRKLAGQKSNVRLILRLSLDSCQMNKLGKFKMLSF
jgi:hypothetical protein